MRQGWIFCGGMIRSGSTLQYQMASELIERHGLGRRTTYIHPSEHPAVLAGLPPAGLSTFKTHELTDRVEAHCCAGTGMALYIYRDLRDVVGSLQQKEGRRLEGDGLVALVERLLDVDKQWRALPQVFVSRYEDVLRDPEREILGLAGFLGIPCTVAAAAELAAALSYEEQEKGINSASRDELVEVNPTNVYHRDTLLHTNHFQGGIVGRYKADLDEEQVCVIEGLAESWLVFHDYPMTGSQKPLSPERAIP